MTKLIDEIHQQVSKNPYLDKYTHQRSEVIKRDKVINWGKCPRKGYMGLIC